MRTEVCPVESSKRVSHAEEVVVKRIKLLLALGAAGALAGAACNKAAGSAPRTSSSGQALTTAMVLRVDLPPAVLPTDPLSLEVSFRNSAGQLLDVSDKVTVSLAVNPTGAVMTGTTTRAAVNGMARFTDLAIAKRGQGYQLLVSSTRATSVKSAPFAVTWSTDEQEAAGTASNDTTAGAEVISPDVPMFGALGPNDVDMYRFHATAGQLLSVATHATRLDLGNWDTSLRLRLLAPNGVTEIARGGAFGSETPSVDTGFAEIRIPGDGDYYLACDTDRRGFLSGRYALVVQLASLPAGLQVETEQPGATGQNDTLATAQALVPGVVRGYSDVAAAGARPPSDYFKIAIPSPAHVRLELTATRNGSSWADNPWNPRLELQDSAGNVLSGSDGAAFVDPSVDFVVTVPGTYYVRVATAATGPVSGSTPYFLTYRSPAYAPTAETADDTTAGTAMPMAYGD